MSFECYLTPLLRILELDEVGHEMQSDCSCDKNGDFWGVRMYHCAAPSTVYSWIFALNDFQHEYCYK